MTSCGPGVFGATAGLFVALSVTAGCSASFSIGGIDYDDLESQITTALDEQYSTISRQVSSIDCPRQDGTPASGESFVCTAQVDGQDVRVDVIATDDDGNFRFETIDLLYDGATISSSLSEQLTTSYGFPVQVDCGTGLTVAAEGETFDCIAVDEAGASRTLRVTSGGYGGSDRWEIIE